MSVVSVKSQYQLCRFQTLYQCKCNINKSDYDNESDKTFNATSLIVRL